MSQFLSNGEIKCDRSVCLEDILNTPDDSDFGYFVEVDLSYPFIVREKTKNFPFSPVNKMIDSDDFTILYEKAKT